MDLKTIQVMTNYNCNLRCKYCYEKYKNTVNTNPDIIKRYLVTVLSNKSIQDNIKNTTIEFIGGESFLYPEKLTEYIEIILAICEKNQLIDVPNIAFSTNGTLFGNDNVRKFISTYGRYLSLGISIDGTKECHDLNRVDIHGNGTYDSIIPNLEFIRKHIPKNKINAKATFNHDTIKYYKDSIMHLIDLGFTEIIANTVYEETWTEDDSIFIFNQLRDVADYLIDNGLENKIIIPQINKNGSNYKNSSLGLSRTTNHCGSCKHMFCLGDNDKIYGCQRFAANMIHPTGHIDNENNIIINNGTIINEVSKQYTTYPKECFDCDFATICGTCAALPYELNIDSKELFSRKMQCGFTKAVGYAQCYFAWRLKEREKENNL